MPEYPRMTYLLIARVGEFPDNNLQYELIQKPIPP